MSWIQLSHSCKLRLIPLAPKLQLWKEKQNPSKRQSIWKINKLGACKRESEVQMTERENLKSRLKIFAWRLSKKTRSQMKCFNNKSKDFKTHFHILSKIWNQIMTLPSNYNRVSYQMLMRNWERNRESFRSY